jgi:hypothetical protein
MERMPTRAAEKIYDILIKYAEASPDYYQKESFVYHFGVKSKYPGEFVLNCMDSKIRKFIKSQGEFKMIGPGANRINNISKKILEESNGSL